MEFTRTNSAIAFVVLFAILVVGTVMSPMSTSTVAVVSVGLLVFGVLSVLIGVKHGEYRTKRER